MKKTIFKGAEALEFENDLIKITVLPDYGGKTASIYYKPKSFELVFQNAGLYHKPMKNDLFSKYDASGFDDAFPNIDAEKFLFNDKIIDFPDHGEVWTTQMHVLDVFNNGVILYGKGNCLPYLFEKKIMLTDNSVTYEYKIKNVGETEIPCFWTMHALVNCEEDMKILFPREVSEIINVHKSKILGEVGTIHSYPITKNGIDLRTVGKPTDNSEEKFYASGKVEKGNCGIVYPSHQVKYCLEYNAEQLPYLGFWITCGGFRGDYNCALEPSNGYYDKASVAEKNNALPVLQPNEVMEFKVKTLLCDYDKNL